MTTSLKLTADLSQDDVKAAIIMYVESQSGMKAESVILNSSANHDALDRSTGLYTVSAKVSLVKRPIALNTGPINR